MTSLSLFSLFHLLMVISVIFVVFNGEVMTDKMDNAQVGKNDALYLTPYIEKGQIEKAQELATVSPFLKGIQSFAGYLTVNKTYSSNIFFWLFKSQIGNWEKRPLVVWLSGGPGKSSILYGLFLQTGPFLMNRRMQLKKRRYDWSRRYNVVYIDSPVGAGFSFTKHDSGYARIDSDVGRDLHGALTQLYTLFPSFKKNKLFINGESYGGKGALALAYENSKISKDSNSKLLLAGIMIASGFIDPISYSKHSDFVYQLGLFHQRTRNKFKKTEGEISSELRSSNFTEAGLMFANKMLEIAAEAGIKSVNDFVNDNFEKNKQETMSFIEDPKTREAIHVGSKEFLNGSASMWYLYIGGGTMQTVKPWVEELLTAEEFPFLFYSGQLDVLIAYPLQLRVYQSLQWPRAKDYQVAKRCQFRVGNEVAGYYKSAGTLTEVLLRNTGHLVAALQPKWTFKLIDAFISNSSAFVCN